MAESDGRKVAIPAKNVVVHSQETTFMMTEFPEGMSGPDNMIRPNPVSKSVTNGESAVKKYRTPY